MGRKITVSIDLTEDIHSKQRLLLTLVHAVCAVAGSGVGAAGGLAAFKVGVRPVQDLRAVSGLVQRAARVAELGPKAREHCTVLGLLSFS